MKGIYAIAVIFLCIGGLFLSCNKTTDDSGYPGFRVTYNGQRYVADSVHAHLANSSIIITAYTAGQKRFEMALLGQTATTYTLGTNSSVNYYENGKTYTTNGYSGDGTVVISKFTDVSNRIVSTKYTDSTTFINGSFSLNAKSNSDIIAFTSGYFNIVPVQ